VAEGVETIEQLVWLKKLQCKYGQGYYFSKPLSAEEAGSLLAEQPTW
jgi:EAL domain-containing protein (putative c-di-GMP-specific phosphodiesterase class I)